MSSHRLGRPRRGAYPGLVRVTLPPSGSGEPRAAYRATARTPGDVRERLFFDSDHGGPDGSREAARSWRAAALAAAAVPDPPSRRIVLKPRSTSGIVGVYRVVRARGTPMWEAYYGSSAGERSVRSFSEGKYGEDGARQRAVQQRREWERADLGAVIPSSIPQRECTMKKCGKRKRRGRSAAGRRALNAPAAGNVPVGLLIAHGAVAPDTGNTGGKRVHPSQAEKAHAARLFADPAEAAEELGRAP